MNEEFLSSPVWQAMGYVISVVIGGVMYKYIKLFIDAGEHKQESSNVATQKLIENLENRLDTLSKQIDQFETERKEIHKRELKRTEELAEAKADVRILMERVKHMEKTISRLDKENQRYRQKYGNLDNEQKT